MRDLFCIVRPTSKLHIAVLFVKGEPFHIDLAGWLVNGRRGPFHVTSVCQLRLGHKSNLILSIRTENIEVEDIPSSKRIGWRCEKIFNLFYLSSNLLVVQHYVWKPDSLAGDIKSFYTAIIIWIPLEFIVVPLLQKHFNNNSHKWDTTPPGPPTHWWSSLGSWDPHRSVERVWAQASRWGSLWSWARAWWGGCSREGGHHTASWREGCTQHLG